MSNIIHRFEDLDLTKRYTYKDYLNWHFEERVELIKGWIHKMSPAPKLRHQIIEGNIHGMMWAFFKGKKCKVIQSPFDVVLLKNIGSAAESNTVVQPDICVICDPEKLTEAGCTGAPDLIVEILSNSTAKKDYNEKFNLYQENGVQEYWIVDPRSNSVETFVLENELYVRNLFFETMEGVITSPLFPQLKINCNELLS